MPSKSKDLASSIFLFRLAWFILYICHMEKFVVSARKYRPATFDTVVGQSHITTTLKNAIRTNHLAQAFLFCGPRGVGKTTCARILAKTINCQSLEDSIEPCHTCKSCRSFDQNTSFTIHELDAASNNSVEDIRNLIDQVRFPPQDGKYKVYIIDEVHMLSQSAFNAFLKTLEEPPKHAIFILATTEKHKILPTILSRCQIFDFNRIQIKDIADHLASIAVKEGIKADYPALELIAQKAEGGLRDALSMFDLNVTFSGGHGLTYEDVLKNLHILDYDYYFRMTDSLFEGSISSVLLLYNDILEKGFDSHQFIVGLNEHFRNLLVAKAPETVKLLEVSPSVQQRYLEQSKKLQTGYLMSCLSVGNHLDIQYKSAKNQRLHIEIGLLKIAQIQQILKLSELPSVEQQQVGDVQAVNRQETPIKIEDKSVSPSVKKVNPTAVAERPVRRLSTLKSTLVLEEEVKLTNEVPQKQNITSVHSKPSTENTTFTSFDSATIFAVLQGFADLRESETEKVILSRAPKIEGENLIFLLDNQIQEGVFTDMKQELATYLRAKFGKSSLSVQFEFGIDETVRKPYTAQEKFEAMLQKNPELETLRQELGLELLY